ncbi:MULTISPECIES: hypothetical protein [Serratia]|uniref:tail fiber/spike domain-containing protein n=1 Tax=Serratia TaxID=613 RepID=UPI00240740F6|nr:MULTISPECIES: hypothetical protein [Serratia]MDF9718808.1 hypothetical protein [Serratia marcescens]HBL7016074.1 hypothetical protein [Serratia marcescens]
MVSKPDYENAIKRAGFIPVNSFEGGFTLTSSEQALYSSVTREYFIWKGALPKAVAVGSSPETSGGFGPAAWANVSYSALGSTSGAALVGHGQTTLDKIISVDVRQFGAKTISEDSIFDSQPAFQAAIDYVKSKGGGIVKFSGAYLIKNAPYSYTLPFDDGTVSPNFIKAGVDDNIPAEPQLAMSVCLEIPSNVQLVGDGIKNSSLNFGWDRNNGVIDCHQNIGIVFRVQGYPSSNRMSAYINNVAISGFAIYNAFIGAIADGVLFDASYIGDMQYQNCGISFIVQGADSVEWGTQIIANCYAGIIIGGMWLTRNNVQLGGIWVPPYGNNDIYSLGWCDYVKIKKIAGTMSSLPWSDRHEEIDKFFDLRFFKSANNVLTVNKGRLSNTGMDLVTPSDYSKVPFRGIASRYFVNLSRYNRGNANLHIEDMKVYFCSRTPVLSAYGQGSDFYGQVSNAFVEMVGKKAVGPNTDENNFYKSGIDELNRDYTRLPALVVEGALGAVKVSIANTFFADPSTSAPTTNNKLVTQQWVPSVTEVQKPSAYTSGTALRYHSAYDGKIAVILERLWRGRYETQPLVFDSGDANNLHTWRTRITGNAHANFYVRNGASGAEISVTNKRASLYYQGGRVKFFISFQFPNNTLDYTDFLTISGLPTGNADAHDFGSQQPELIVQRAVIRERVFSVPGGTLSLPMNIMSARLDSGAASFFADQNSISGYKLRCSDFIALSTLTLSLEYNTTWGLYNNDEGY